MLSAVIVAIPEENDKTHKISSEKVPHLTMLYLGDVTDTLDIPDIVTFVEHAAEHLDPFWLTVDYRGTLGDDQADVIFFEDTYFEMPQLKTFRHQLLLNESIRRAYDSTNQFPEWQPHLTLGYPDAPAKEDDSDFPGIHHVNFDRLAVWFGDYEGPEIRLKYDRTAMEVAMSGTNAERGALAASAIFKNDPNAAKQYGVKGMKWGVTTVDKASKTTVIRDNPGRRGAKDVTVSQRKAGKYVTTRGGQRQRATDEAVKAQAGRQKAKKSTTDALTNQELKDTIERMRLEQEFSKLDKRVSRRGETFISKMFQDPETRAAAAELAKRVAVANA